MEGWGMYEERYATETDFLATWFSILHLYNGEETHSIPAMYKKNGEDGNLVFSFQQFFTLHHFCNSLCNFHPNFFFLTFPSYWYLSSCPAVTAFSFCWVFFFGSYNLETNFIFLSVCIIQCWKYICYINYYV
jgi:hypothetical protein